MLNRIFDLGLFMLLTFAVQPMSPEEIVKKGLEALGGEEAVRSVQSRKFSGDATFSGGAAFGKFVFIQKKPEFYRADFDVQGSQVIQAFDGSEAWQLQPVAFGGSGSPEVVTGKAGDSIRQSAQFDSPLLDYQKKGHVVRLVGVEDFEGQDVYHLELTQKDGPVTHYYLDTETFLSHKTVTRRFNAQSGTEVEVEFITSDWREVNGLRVAHLLDTRSGGQSFTKLHIRNVEFNFEVGSEFFRRSVNTEMQK